METREGLVRKGGQCGKGAVMCVCMCVCVFLGLREECVGWRAGRVEPRTFLAVELGGGNS